MNLQIIYRLEDERGAFLFKQQLRVCFGSRLCENYFLKFKVVNTSIFESIYS